jgi:hypothetical protein
MRRQTLGITVAFFALLSLFINIGAGNPAADLDWTVTRSIQVEEASWPMAGANPERTSWTSEEVRGELKPLWYKPFEPYISQKVQIIAAYNTLYIATAKGLYALDAGSGAQRWVYPTALPLGHSPTIQDGIAYVGGFDHKLHAIDAFTGHGLWTFEAEAGFQTNPLVVAGKVYVGNRDGFFYAIHAHGVQRGQLAWKYPTQGPILFSAAYKGGVVYFASQDSHAYALNAQTGALVWKSAKLPGAGFHSFWPVVYQERVIFAGSHNYRSSSQFSPPGKNPVREWDEVYPNRQSDPDGTPVGPLGEQPGPWAPGTLTLDTSQPNVTPNGQTTPITEYLESKPWRRTYFVLDRQSGQEVTYDFDRDGRPEYAPMLWFGTHSGNRYPPIVGGDGVLYQSNDYQSSPAIPWGHISGWQLDTPFISLPAPERNAADEPQGYVAGGNLIYWNRCCDRVGAAFDLSQADTGWTYFRFDLEQLLPGYNRRYYNPDEANFTAVYAAFGSPNGVYGFHADTNPPIPYQGKVYMHRSNAVLAFAPAAGVPQALELAPAVPAPPPGLTPLGPSGLKARLALEIQKMLSAGHLRPGYASHGHFDMPSQYQCGDDLVDYFHHPADTLITLLQAFPHLPPGLQPQVRAYLQNEFTAYPPHRFNHIGWQDGAAREAFDLPPELDAARASLPPQEGLLGFVWSSNPYNFYALWQYAAFLNDPQQAHQLFQEAQSSDTLMDSLTTVPDNAVLARMPLVHNAYIAGYLGYLGLERLAGQPESSPMRQELERLMQLRASQFSKDSAYATAVTREEGAYCRTLNVASNFMYLVPELASYLQEHALAKVQAALAEYEQIAPYWFVSFAAEGFGENALVPLYDTQALFLAKAWILEEPGTELEKYLDMPAFARGDLFYIQKLVAAIENYQSVEISIHIDEQEMQGSPFGLAPGVSIRKSFPGINGGPVLVSSTDGTSPIFSSQRAIFGSSFNSIAAYPADQLTTDYWFTSYDDLGMITYLVIGNPHATLTAEVDVYIGGIKRNTIPYAIAPGQRIFPRYGINGGPVHVVSTNGVDIFTSERTKFGPSFNEVMGYPGDQLSTDYWFTSYDDTSMITFLVIGNPHATLTAQVDVYIAGVKKNLTPYVIAPGQRVFPRYAIDQGPVQVISTNGVDIFTSERSKYLSSFNEILGLANDRLTTDYWFTAYDDVGMSTFLVIAAP